MKSIHFKFLITLTMLCTGATVHGSWLTNDSANRKGFALISRQGSVPLIYDKQDFAVVEIATGDLAEDIHAVTGQTPDILTSLPDSILNAAVLIGTLGKSDVINAVASNGKVPELKTLRGQWEGYLIKVVEYPLPGIKRALVIAGSDRRGTAFGVYQLSKAIGVSPWHWWAEVPVKKRDTLLLREDLAVLEKPHVRYRGMFLNDEIFGMAPWSKETFDTEHPDYIGPRTYEKIFELQLRLRSNYIWPALKKKSGPFSAYPENRILADRYAIVVGSQHSEPLSSYGGEWDPKVHGEYNYFTNRKGILEFLEGKVAENKKYENIYTMGLRGIDDVSMEGNPTLAQNAGVLEKIIKEQNEILLRQIDKPLSEIPQNLVLYKEVTKAFNFGFNLPEDITLIWGEDNYGYIKQLPDSKNVDRVGGHGVYYHLAYLGRPNDYSWLSGVHSHLLVSEMKKAVSFGADRTWVFNTGDIKAVEYDFTLAMDIAWDPASITHENILDHQTAFYAAAFGKELAPEIARLRADYEQLAFARRAEHMAWSRLEQWRKSTESEFSWIHHREAEKRLEASSQLLERSQKILDKIPEAARDAYYHLIHFRVAGFDAMNRKWLYLSRYTWHQRQGRSNAYHSYEQAWQGFADVWKVCDKLTQSANGKWDKFTSMYDFDVYQEPCFAMPKEKCRGIRPEPFEPFYQRPELPVTVEPGIWVQGDEEKLGMSNLTRRTPVLCAFAKTETFVEIFNRGTAGFPWTAIVDAPWVELSASSGRWTGSKNVRLGIRLLSDKLPKPNPEHTSLEATVTLSVGNWQQAITVPVFHPELPDEVIAGTFIEQAGVVSIPAEEFQDKRDSKRTTWQVIKDFGLNGAVVTAGPVDARRFPDDWKVKENPYLEYRFYTFNRGWVDIEVSTLPTFPSNKERGSIYAVSLNDDAEIICDFSSYQRDDKWMQGVERNRTEVRTRHFIREPGWQSLRLYLCDPGVLFDHILIDLGGKKDTYLPPAPSKAK